MAKRPADIIVQSTFNKGRITEATDLNFPPEAAADESNCVFGKNGDVTRRKGFEYETGYATASVTHLTTGVINEYVWETVAGIGTLSIVVVQVDNLLSFYEVDSAGALSSGIKSFSVNLNTYKTGGSPSTATVPASFSSGDGRLFVAHPYCETFYVTYDNDTDTISETQLTIQVRDFDGVTDDVASVDERPATLSTAHKYNIFNQGWWITNVRSRSGSQVTPYTQFFTWMGVYPANSDIWFLGRNSVGNLDDDSYEQNPATGSPAAQGHYILTAVNKDRSSASGIAGIATTTSGYYRPSCTAFFAGRVWYSGVQGQDYNGAIYYSQSVSGTDDYGHCYSRLDPTDEHYFDVLETDGGEIKIQDCGNILFMFSLEKSLVIFADNGIWYISGSDGDFFSATNVSVKKLSSIAALSELSTTDIEGNPIFWNAEGIYAISFDPKSQGLSIDNLSENTIYKDFYDQIPVANKAYAKGYYNPRTRIVQWCYKLAAATTLDTQFEYDRILNFNVVTKAFYTWTTTATTTGPTISGLVITAGSGSTAAAANVTMNDLTTQVFKDDGTTAVTSTITTTTVFDQTTKYLSLIPVSGTTFNLTWSEEKLTTYLDWTIFDATGVDYDSYALTGPLVLGKTMIDGQTNYFTVFTKTETGAALWLKARWEWANSATGGRYSQAQNTYPSTPSNRQYYSLQRKRLKVRGQGEAVQFYFYSETGKPFTLIGFSGYISLNQTP